MKRYRKALVAVVGAIVAIGVDVYGWNHLVGMENHIVNALIVLMTALGVWAAPNKPDQDALARKAATRVLQELKAAKR